MCKECAICLDDIFTTNDKRIMRLKKKVLVKRGEKLQITKLKCGHMYHNDCIKKWFTNTDVESSTKCPMCRDTIRFKPDSKDFMMHKLRYDDKHYEYGDENMYDIESDYDDIESDYDDTDSSSSEVSSEDSSEYDETSDDYTLTDDPETHELLLHIIHSIDEIAQLSEVYSVGDFE